jgi:hypothetical protein
MTPAPVEEVETVLVFRSGERLHLPDDDGGPLCSSVDDGWRAKPIAAYPEGHRRWCAFCRDVFDEREGVELPSS